MSSSMRVLFRPVQLPSTHVHVHEDLVLTKGGPFKLNLKGGGKGKLRASVGRPGRMVVWAATPGVVGSALQVMHGTHQLKGPTGGLGTHGKLSRRERCCGGCSHGGRMQEAAGSCGGEAAGNGTWKHALEQSCDTVVGKLARRGGQ